MPRADMGGITHVPTARRALTGVLALTVAGIAAAGPAEDSAADARATAAVAASAHLGSGADKAAPAPDALRLDGLRTGIHTGTGPGGDEIRTGPARTLERTAGRGTRRVVQALRPSLTRRTGTIHRQRAVTRVRPAEERDARAGREGRTDRKASRHRRVRENYQTRKAAHKARKHHAASRPGRRHRATGELGRVLTYALDQVGKPYRHNAAGPGSYDCSGLVSVAYRKAGVKLPHSSNAIARKGKKVRRADLRPGDVVMPHSGHVGIYVGDGKMVHAATPGQGVVVSEMYAFSTARRLL